MMDTPVNEFFIEKARMPVALMLLGGRQLCGELFIQASARHLSALEDAPEFMNGSEPFFPLRVDDGQTLLVAKSHVLSLTVPREFAAAATSNWTYAERARVEVAMDGGSTHEGVLLVEHYVSGARVLDHLNHLDEPFMLLHSEKDVRLLNRAHIVYVRQLDDAAA
jgi:hypothetical protein